MCPLGAESTPNDRKPVLFVDVDGVISLFGFDQRERPAGSFHSIDGIPHLIGSSAAERLGRLLPRFELVWATGWEEKANEYLPALLALPQLPSLTFAGRKVFGEAHWKLEAIDEYARGRPAAWIDDSLDDRCAAWARKRPEPTLLIETEPGIGIDETHVELLIEFADSL